MTYRAFPPGRGHVLVPLVSRAAALAGLSLYAPCTRNGVLIQRLGWVAVSVLGPGALPGRPAEWHHPAGREVWEELLGHWRRIAGAFDNMAICQPRQTDRPRAAFTLLTDGRPRAFVKLRRGEEEMLAREAEALEAMRESPPRAFFVPRLMERGQVEDWHFLVMEPLPLGRHAPAWRAPLEQVVDEVKQGLSMLSRPDSVPEHWEPKHGDLAVWNLRRTGRNLLVLVDWEHAGWGPPRTDEVFFQVTAAALAGRDPDPMEGVSEAIDFWRRQPQFQVGPRENLDYEFVLRAQDTLKKIEGARPV